MALYPAKFMNVTRKFLSSGSWFLFFNSSKAQYTLIRDIRFISALSQVGHVHDVGLALAPFGAHLNESSSLVSDSRRGSLAGGVWPARLEQPDVQLSTEVRTSCMDLECLIRPDSFPNHRRRKQI